MDEDRALSVLLIAICAPVALATLVSGARFGSGPTLAAVLAVLGAAGLTRRSQPLIPRARWRKHD